MISAIHLHALLIHFPIALLFVGYFSEIIGLISKNQFFKNVSLYLLVLGVLGAIAAYISGSYAGNSIESSALKIPVELHKQAALITLLLAIVTILFMYFIYYFKKNNPLTNWMAFILFTLLISSITFTGYLGGQLVYSQGAGVDLMQPTIKK